MLPCIGMLVSSEGTVYSTTVWNIDRFYFAVPQIDLEIVEN